MKSFHDGKIALHAGDCLNVLKAMPENSIDAVVTDPPYHLTSIVKRFGGATAAPAKGNEAFIRASRGFMGKQWDGGDIAFRPELWIEVLRVLKPGGHMVAFSGTRTYHRMAVAIEDAGFEIRDQLAWVYGSGFPKSHDVSKGIDRALGAEREIIGRGISGANSLMGGLSGITGEQGHDITAPATDAARQWEGWGTALKPAFEPICLCRKPLSESTIAANVLRWGVGALNIDGCRVSATKQDDYGRSAANGRGTKNPHDGFDGEAFKIAERNGEYASNLGRWPANLCHDGSPEVLAGFPNGEARYFYTSKADADDRLRSVHPTVKPVNLMQWLVRLVCPKGATVLDLFAGTGTTGAASFIEGRRCVLIEREAEYLADIEKRIGMLLSGSEERSWKLAKPEPLEALPLFALTGD